MINDELKSLFRWYDDINKQNRYKGYCKNLCDYRLITPTTNILPFQIRTSNPEGFALSITSWKIYCEDGTLYRTLDISGLILTQTDEVFYITFLTH